MKRRWRVRPNFWWDSIAVVVYTSEGFLDDTGSYSGLFLEHWWGVWWQKPKPSLGVSTVWSFGPIRRMRYEVRW